MGTLTNLKGVLIKSQNIIFQDSINMTQLGSLNNACGPKGLNLRIQKLDLGEV
jgi:hypothetical protein